MHEIFTQTMKIFTPSSELMSETLRRCEITHPQKKLKIKVDFKMCKKLFFRN